MSDPGVRPYTDHIGPVSSVAFAPDGTTLASVDMNGVRIWDARTGQQLHQLTGHTGTVSSVAFAPDGATLASGGDTTIWLWDPRNGAQIDGTSAPGSLGPAEAGYVRKCLEPQFREEREDRRWNSPGVVEVVTLLNSGENRECARAAEVKAAENSDLDLYYDWGGTAYLRMKEYQLARRILLKGLAKGKRKSGNCSVIGEVEWKAGNAKEATYWWIQAVHCQESIKDDAQESPYLYLHYVADGLGLADVAAAFIDCVDRIRAGGIRLSPASAADLTNLVRQQATPGMRHVVTAVRDRYLKPSPPAKDELSQPGQKLSLLLRQIEGQLKSRPNPAFPMVSLGLRTTESGRKVVWCLSTSYGEPAVMDPSAAASFLNQELQTIGVTVSSGGWTEGPGSEVNHLFDYEFQAAAPDASTPQPAQAATTPADFQTFTNSDNSFSIAYPGDWQQAAATTGIGSTFTSQDQQKTFIIRVNLSIPQADLATSVSTACSKAGGTPSSPQTVSIGGQPWTKVECDTSDGSNHLVVAAADYKGQRFGIVYTAPKASFDSDASRFFTPMEQTFQFLPSHEPKTSVRPSLGAVVDLRSNEERQMAARSQAQHEHIAHELGVADLTSELISLVGEDNSGFANRARIREIGEELYRRGGHSLMQEAYYHVTSTKIYFSQDIWDRIGEWQA